METQKQDTPLYFGTFQNAKQVNINGGSFAINHNNPIKRELNTDINIKKLYEHISTTALHNSRERAQEVPEAILKNIVHEWSSRLRTLPTTTPTDSSLPLSSPFDRLSTDDALYDVFKWLCDPLSSYSVVWMYENTETQALLLANALARILQQHRLLSASYFFSATTDSASVVPTIAYQLAQNITQAAVPIARVVGQNPAVFASRCDDQVEQLVVKPLKNASDLCNEYVEAPKVIIIHGLEDHNDNDNFQTLFLDSLTRAVVSLEITHFPQKLLVLGRYTDRLQKCFSNLASQLKIIQRPIQLHNVLEKEHEICRKEKEMEERDKTLANKEKSINARVEALRRELRQEAHLRNADLTEKLRGAELANDTLRNEKEQLTERMAQLEREQKQSAADRTRLEHQLKQVLEDLTTEKHTYLQRQQETLEHRTGLENVVKRLQEELAAFQQQKNIQLDSLRDEKKQLTERMAQLQREQKQMEEHRTRLEYQLKQQEDLTTIQRTHLPETLDEEMAESHVAEEQTPEVHSDDRGATLVQHSSSSHPFYIGGLPSKLITLLGQRSAAVVEISRDELRQLQTQAKQGHHYRKEYENLKNDFSRLVGDTRAQTRYLQSENQRLKEGVGSLEHELKSVTKRYEEVKSLSDTRGKELVGIQYENQRLEERVGSLEHELKSVTKRYEDVKSLSDTRGKELVGARVFLSKTDSLSISDVVQKVHSLNDEIFQAAAFLGDSIVRSKERISEEVSKQYVDHSKSLLGPSLAEILHTAAGKSDEPVDPLLVQVTLQALLVDFCKKKIDQWTEVELSTDQFLHTLYHEIRSSSEQAVSGRWRALARGQLKLETNTWFDELTPELRAILMAASWEVTAEDEVRSFAARVKAIFKAVLDVRTAIGEKVTSADIEINVVRPGSPFIKAMMEDAFSSNKPEARFESVIATTGIGLWKVGPSNGPSVYTVVLSPKIVLDSTLKSVPDPPPPPAARQKRTKTSKPDEKLKRFC